MQWLRLVLAGGSAMADCTGQIELFTPAGRLRHGPALRTACERESSGA
jgi:hypothetical protein